MPKVTIHLEVTVPLVALTVNEIIKLFQGVVATIAAQLVTCWLEEWQELEVGKGLEGERTLQCPGCGAEQGFQRRGWRPRVLRKTSLGRIEFRLRQISCQGCGKTFAPWPERLGLEPYQVSSLEYRERAVGAACQMSYRRSAKWVSDMPLAARVSASSLHNWVQEMGPTAAFAVEAAAGHDLLLDGTEVRAGQEPRGTSLRLGMALTGRSVVGGRAQLAKKVVAFSVGEKWSATLAPLREMKPARFLYDGEKGLVDQLRNRWPDIPRQRCLWHLVQRLYPTLWKDGLNQRLARPFQRRLSKLLYQLPLAEAKAAFNSLGEELRSKGYGRADTYFRLAQDAVFTFLEQPAGFWSSRPWQTDSTALVATSPLEREFRELNRRTDNGSRWTISGVDNLIRLDLVRRYDDAQWSRLWQLGQPTAQHLPATIINVESTFSVPFVKTS